MISAYVKVVLDRPRSGFSRSDRSIYAALAAGMKRWVGLQFVCLAVALSVTTVHHASAQQTAPPPDTAAPAAPPSPEAGAKLFAASGCTQCHGPEGNGTAKAPSIHEVRKRKTDAEIYLQIKEGKGAMPAFGDALTEEEMRSIVAFLHAKDGWKLLPATADK